MLNVLRLKNQLKKAIQVSPTSISLRRESSVSDGIGGFVKEGYENKVATFDGLLVTASSSRNSDPSSSDGGNTETITQIKLSCPFENNFKIEHDDYFTVDLVTYKVVHAIPLYNVMWVCTLEVDV